MHVGFNNRARFIGFYRGDGEAKLASISRRRRRSLDIYTSARKYYAPFSDNRDFVSYMLTSVLYIDF